MVFKFWKTFAYPEIPLIQIFWDGKCNGTYIHTGNRSVIYLHNFKNNTLTDGVYLSTVTFATCCFMEKHIVLNLKTILYYQHFFATNVNLHPGHPKKKSVKPGHPNKYSWSKIDNFIENENKYKHFLSPFFPIELKCFFSLYCKATLELLILSVFLLKMLWELLPNTNHNQCSSFRFSHKNFWYYPLFYTNSETNSRLLKYKSDAILN